jgi:hypothetical protein
VLAAHLLPKLVADLATALTRLHVKNLARRRSLEAGSTREKKGGEERRYVRNSVWKFGTGNRKLRWRARVYPERGKWFYKNHFNLSGFWRREKQSALGVGGCGREIFVLVTCPEDAQRGGFNPRGDVLSTSSSRWPVAPRRARNRRSIFEP